MISIALSGGLGNQMFEYAFIYAQHKQLGKPFFITKTGGTIILYKYFKLDRNKFYWVDRFIFDHEGFKLFFSHYLRNAFYNGIGKSLKKHQVIADNWNDPNEVLTGVKSPAEYYGYFQSEKYFAGKANLDDIFEIRPKYVKVYNEKFAWLKKYKTVVAVHVRRTDYANALGHLNLGGDNLILPLTYYHNTISKIHSDENFYVFISDDIKGTASAFSYLNNTYFSAENEIIDFQLMLNAHTCIIANSTFSWWAAYLNSQKNKVVYCPEHFLGFLKGTDYPVDIYPPEWIKITV